MNLCLIPLPKKILITDERTIVRKADLRLSDALRNYVKKADEVFDACGDTEITLAVRPSLKKEEYRLWVSGSGVEIASSTPNGAYYALLTLAQLFTLNSGEICCLEIEDEPDMPLRGISDDISRGQVSTFENYKDIIRRLSYVKCNVYMPYMEDTFAFKKYPESGKYSDPVSQEEWTALIEYAKDYYVEILPIFNTIGHWDKNAKLDFFYPYVMKENDEANGKPLSSVDVRKPESRRMIFDMLDEIASVFGEAGAIHVGGDEVGDYTRLFKKDLAGRYYNEHFNRVYDYLKGKGIKTYMYSDMYTPLYGDYALGIDYIDQMPADMNFVFWDYAVRKDYPNIRNLIERNKTFCLSPATYTWNRMLPQHYISFLNTKSLAAHAADNARGIIMSAWNDGGLALREENWMGIYTGALFSWSCLSVLSFEDMVSSFFRLFFGLDVDMNEYESLMSYDRNFVKHPYDDAAYEGKLEFWYDHWQNGGSMFLKEFLKEAGEPQDENVKEKLSGAEQIFERAYAYFSALAPERNRPAYDAFLFDIKRSLIAAKKIFLMKGKTLASFEIDGMIEDLLSLKKEHRDRWFDCNRTSEWSKVENKYDQLIESFRALKGEQRTL